MFISSNGWKRGSAHTPMLIGPVASWISQSQYPASIKWVVALARRPFSGMRASHSSSSVQSSKSRPFASRNHAALQWWPLSVPRSSLRRMMFARPLASTIQPAVMSVELRSSESSSAWLSVIVCFSSPRSMSSTFQPRKASTPAATLRSKSSFSNRPRSIWCVKASRWAGVQNSTRFVMSELSPAVR